MPFSITAVGDISFQGKNADKPAIEVFSSVIPYLKSSSLVIANLENPLLGKGDPVPGKCTLRGNPGWTKVLSKAGIHVLSLANNHMMDYGEAGLLSTIRALENSGLVYVGAGKNKEEACAPKFLCVKSNRIAFLARTSIIVSSPSYAGRDQPGVAFLDVNETKEKIKACKGRADIVILLIHWGLEEYLYPSPEQRELAAEFIDAGAELILGHHPHVLQGIERMGNGIVVYSLGNFLFDEFEWIINVPESGPKRLFSSLSIENRRGIILKISKDTKNCYKISKIFTRIDNNSRILLDNELVREIEFDSLSKKLSSSIYKYWWKIYAIRKEWDLRVKPTLSLKRIICNIWKIRPKHVKELLDTFRKSAKITAGKSTNPYD